MYVRGKHSCPYGFLRMDRMFVGACTDMPWDRQTEFVALGSARRHVGASLELHGKKCRYAALDRPVKATGSHSRMARPRKDLTRTIRVFAHNRALTYGRLIWKCREYAAGRVLQGNGGMCQKRAICPVDFAGTERVGAGAGWPVVRHPAPASSAGAVFSRSPVFASGPVPDPARLLADGMAGRCGVRPAGMVRISRRKCLVSMPCAGNPAARSCIRRRAITRDNCRYRHQSCHSSIAHAAQRATCYPRGFALCSR